MARQLSAFRRPSVSQREHRHSRWRDGGVARVRTDRSAESPTLVAADGRQDFRHFWMYPLVVAPVLAVVRATGLHWNYAFTIVNIALLAVFAWCAVSTLGTSATVLLACCPIIWWIDKAHIEVFNFALLGTALVLCGKAPRTALLLLGVLTAQNPGFAVIFVPVAAALLWTTHGTERGSLAAAAAGAGLIAAMHPAYYFWRFGGPTPLSTALSYNWPGLTAIVTPIIDPDLGLCWWFPGLLVTLGISALGKRNRKARSHEFVGPAAASIGFLLMLVLVAASGNVNHGATPGVSRYAIWLAPFAIVAFRTDGGDGLRRWLLTVVAQWPRRGRLPGRAIRNSPRTRWPRHPPRSGSRITCRDSTIQCPKCSRSVTRESTGPCRCRCRAMSAARSCCRAFVVRVCAGPFRAHPPRYRSHAERLACCATPIAWTPDTSSTSLRGSQGLASLPRASPICCGADLATSTGSR